MLNGSSLKEVVNIVNFNQDSICNKNNFEVVERYFAGRHRIVFELKNYPKHIMKLQPASSDDDVMFETIQKCYDVVQQKPLTKCCVPFVQREQVGEKTLWIEQKLNGVYDSGLARDVSEKLFQKFVKDAELRDQWVETFVQAAEFILATGYHDVDWRNVLLMDEGVGFIDFEKITQDPDQTASGIFRLLQIAPLEAIDPILVIVEREGLKEKLFKYAVYDREFFNRGFTQDVPFEKAVEILKTMRQEQLSFHASIFKHYENKKIQDVVQPLLSSSKDLVGQKIVERCNNRLQESSFYSQSPLYVRSLFWQPFTYDAPCDKETFDRALHQLKVDGDIADWVHSKGFEGGDILYQYDDYTIYF